MCNYILNNKTISEQDLVQNLFTSSNENIDLVLEKSKTKLKKGLKVLDNLKLKINKTYTAKDLVLKLIPHANNEIVHDTLVRLSSLPRLNEIKVNLREIIRYNNGTLNAGLSYGDQIDLSMSVINSEASLAQILAHELIHSYTVLTIRRPRTEKDKKLVGELSEIYNSALQVSQLKSSYGFKDQSEFLAELFSNKKFAEELKSLTTEGNFSLYEKFLNFIRNLFGLSEKQFITIYDEAVELGIQILDSKNIVLSPQGKVDRLLLSDSTHIDFLIEGVEGEFINDILIIRPDRIANRVAEGLEELSEHLTKDLDSGEYTHTPSKTKYQSVTDYINGGLSWFYRNINTSEKDYATWIADTKWGKRDKTEKLHTSYGHIDHTTFIERYRESIDKGIAKGNIVHKHLERFINGDPTGVIKAQIDQIAFDNKFHPLQFKWVQDRAKLILEKAGVNIFDSNIKEEDKDVILSETKIKSDLLGLGGTVDNLIFHSDGSVSIKDIKTGLSIVKETMSDIFLFGDQGSGQDILWNNPLNRAKLQLMLYAVILKSENPDIKFRSLDVVWVPNENSILRNDPNRTVQVTPFLSMIESVIRNRKPEVYKKLKDSLSDSEFKKLFDPKEYQVGYSKNLAKQVKESVLSPAELLHVKMEQLRHAVFYDLDPHRPTKEFTSKRLEQAKRLTKEILELKSKTNDLDLISWKEDISFLSEWLGTTATSSNPYVQVFHSFLRERQTVANQRYQESRAEFLSFLKPIYNLYLQRTGKKTISNLTYNKLVNIDYEDLYGFMYKEIYNKEGELVKYELNHTEEDWQEATNKYDYLNKDNIKIYRAFAEFIHKSYSQFFINEQGNFSEGNRKIALANKTATYKSVSESVQKPVTNLQLHNGELERSAPIKDSFVYSKGFFPKVPRRLEEFGSILNKNRAKEAWKRFSSFYIEDVYEGWHSQTEALPMKYLGNSIIDANPQKFSMNIEYQFDKFMKAYINKEELDDVYALGKGIQYMAQSNQQDRLADFLDKQIKQQIQGISQSRTSKKNFVGKNKYNLDFLKMLGGLKNVAAAPIMWLNIVGGSANSVFTYMFAVKESVKNQVMKNGADFFGIDGKSVDFTAEDLFNSHKSGFQAMMRDSMTAQLKGNKDFLLLKKFGYLPNNWDWASNPSELMSTSMNGINQDAFYMFYSIPEEAIATMIMISQLKSMKIKEGPLKGTSLYDMYSPVENYNSNGEKFFTLKWKDDPTTGKPYVRGVLKNEDGSFTELTELDGKEISRLFFAYEKIHGGYRSSERSKLDYYIIGQLFLQFRRYLPNILRIFGMSSAKRSSVGFYKHTEEQENGKDILEWQSNIMEGRWIVLGKYIQNLMGSRFKIENPSNELQMFMNTFLLGNENYNWEELSDNQKEALIESVTSLSMWLMMFAGYIMIFGADGGDDDSFKKWYARIMNDFYQPYNPLEFGKNLTNIAPIGPGKTYSAFNNLITTTLSGMQYVAGDTETALTQEGTLRGWNALQRDIPFLGARRRVVNFYEDLNPEWDFIFRSPFPND